MFCFLIIQNCLLITIQVPTLPIWPKFRTLTTKIKPLVTCTKVSFGKKMNMPYYEDFLKIAIFSIGGSTMLPTCNTNLKLIYFSL
jgi:hypothetical protein